MRRGPPPVGLLRRAPTASGTESSQRPGAARTSFRALRRSATCTLDALPGRSVSLARLGDAICDRSGLRGRAADVLERRHVIGKAAGGIDEAVTTEAACHPDC